MTSDAKEMADLMQKQFCSVFSSPDCPKKKDPSFAPAPVSLEDFDFNEQHIAWAIDKIKISLAPGMDEISAMLLKCCKDEISHPLYMTWCDSLDSSNILNVFLTQLIAPA